MIFYRSFWDALSTLDCEDRICLLDAILSFGLDGKEPDSLQGHVLGMFGLIKPQIEANNRRYENGTKGGRPKKENQAKTKAKPKETNEKPNVNENVNENMNVNVNKNNHANNNFVYYPDEKLNQTFLDFINMRKEIRKPLTDKALQLVQKKLRELSKIPFSDSMDNDLAIKILEQSILNTWQDLYPLKQEKQKQGERDILDEWRRS